MLGSFRMFLEIMLVTRRLVPFRETNSSFQIDGCNKHINDDRKDRTNWHEFRSDFIFSY